MEITVNPSLLSRIRQTRNAAHRPHEQNVQQFHDQLRVALIEFALFDAIDEMLDLVRISCGNVIVVFHRRRSRRSYARQKLTPRPKRKCFLFSRGLTAGTRGGAINSCRSAGPSYSPTDISTASSWRFANGWFWESATVLPLTLEASILRANYEYRP